MSRVNAAAEKALLSEAARLMDFNQNYFEIFGLPIDYRVDTAELASRYLELQKEIHPDKFASSTEHEKRLAMQWSSLVNTANETLASPLQRAVYMLELKGLTIDHNPSLPPEFLMKQIELREELEDLEEDDAGIDKLDEFRKRVTDEIGGLEIEYGESSNDEKSLTLVYEMQFLNKLLIAADHLEEKLLDY